MTRPAPAPHDPPWLLRTWLRVVSVLVPALDRTRWRDEWTGELHSVDLRDRRGLTARIDLMAGMLRDGLDVRRDGWTRTTAHSDRPRLAASWDRFRLDARHAVRGWQRAPIATVGLIATLAIGLGANTAIFVVADDVLLAALPYAQSDRLFVVWETGPQQTAERTRVSLPDFLDWRERAGVFEALAAYTDSGLNVVVGDRSIRVDGQIVSSNFFSLLGVAPVVGRDFLPEEEHEHQGLTVVVSHQFWRDELGGDPQAISRALPVNGQPRTIVGVMPQDFHFPGDASVWLPIGTLTGNFRLWRASHVLTVIGRLTPDSTPRAAESAMTTLAQQLWEHGPLWNDWRITIRPLRTEIYGDFSRDATLLWAGGLLLWVVMCANLANLFVADGLARRAERAVRQALGADHWTLARAAAVDITLLLAVAVPAGLVCASLLLGALANGLPMNVASLHPMALDGRALWYVAGVAGSAALILGVVRAAPRGRTSLRAQLQDEGRTATGSGSSRTRQALVTSQVAVSLTLLITTLLLLESHRQLGNVDPGFEPDRVLSFQVALAGPGYDAPESRRQFLQRVEARLRETPGIGAAATTSRAPFAPAAQSSIASVFVVDRDRDPSAPQPLADVQRISPGLLSVLDVAVEAGRDFRAADDLGATPVALVNRTAAEMLWPGRDPVGERIRTGVTDDAELMVVGVTRDIRLSDLRRPATAQVFIPASLFPPHRMTFVMVTDQPVDAIASRLRSAVADVDPTQPIHDLAALGTHVTRSLAGPALSARVLTALSALSLALVAIGIYAVVAVTVERRTAEFGVRRALGARPRDVVRLAVSDTVVVVGAGLLLGTIGGALTSSLGASQLFGVSPTDPRVYLLGAAAIGSLALAAAVAPAVRAARVDPAKVFRAR